MESKRGAAIWLSAQIPSEGPLRSPGPRQPRNTSPPIVDREAPGRSEQLGERIHIHGLDDGRPVAAAAHEHPNADALRHRLGCSCPHDFGLSNKTAVLDQLLESNRPCARSAFAVSMSRDMSWSSKKGMALVADAAAPTPSPTSS